MCELLFFSPTDRKYRRENRKWQGIPGITMTSDGTLWAVWYSGGDGEGPENYVLVVNSKDKGINWSEPIIVIDPPDDIRAFDPCLWTDPYGKLWLFWAMSKNWWDGKAGVWAITGEQVGDGCVWSKPRRIADGIMMNKPAVLSTGEWLFPIAVWNREPFLPEMDNLRFSNVYISKDNGKTITFLGSADVPERMCDEHMIVELKTGVLRMLVRTSYGIGESFSYDRGKTWIKGCSSNIAGPGSRFHIRRLNSGNLLLINHYGFSEKNRSHLTAMLSEDDGKTWPYKLLLDERDKVSYPDAIETKNGEIFIIYDYDRYGKKEILMAVVTEQDIKAGEIITPDSKLKMPVDDG
ncbi:MAG TPA: sialidase family protein [bacterium]|nr:sialidase family protein [bacterium]HOL49294.1 sialidase family protein [bacterium]HPO51381.1 sialidase family protein [bacterium]